VLPPDHTTETPLLPADWGADQTVSVLRSLVDSSRALPVVRAAALEALQDAASSDESDQLSALLDWVRDRVRFVQDPADVEYVQSPVYLLETIRREGVAYGDCDCSAGLFAALAESVGYPTRFVLQGGEPGEPFSHILVETETRGGWVAVDASQQHSGLGWKPRSGVSRERAEVRPMLTRGHGLGQAVDEGTDLWGGFSDFLGSLTEAAGQVAKTTLPLLERYGVTKPVVGYTAQGAPIYAGAVLPAGGATGAAYTALTQPTSIGGLTGTQLLMIGGGALVLLLVLKKGK